MSIQISIEKVINESILKGMSNMIVSVLKEVVAEYGVVNKEIIEKMNLSMSVSVIGGEKKEKKVALKEKTLKSKVVFPFNGRMNEGRCHALIQNHGLYTQCENSVSVCETKYCKKCGSGEKYGSIEERLAVGIMEYRDPKGKSPTAYVKVMKKLKISREEVEAEAGKLNIKIDDIHFLEEEKKEKGRPKKEKKIIELEDNSTDLFASLVASASANEELSDTESVSDNSKESVSEDNVNVDTNEKAAKLAEKQKKDAEKAEKEAAKLAEKEKKDAEKAEKEAAKLAEKQKKDAEKAEKEAAKLAEKAEKEAAKLAEKQKKDAEKAEKEAAKLAEKEKKEAEKKQKPAKKEEKPAKKTEEKPAKKAEEKPAKKEEKPAKKAEEAEEEDVVKRFEFEGVKYLKSKKTGIIYNMDQDIIGKWNDKTNKIDFYEADSEEEEEEYDE